MSAPVPDDSSIWDSDDADREETVMQSVVLWFYRPFANSAQADHPMLRLTHEETV